jgi:hypothetical protein
MKHAHLLALTILPSNLDAVSVTAPNGSIHAAVSTNFRDADGTVYNSPEPPRDEVISDARIGAMARELMDAVAEYIADRSAMPVRSRVDAAAPLTQPTRTIGVVR